MEIHFVKPLNLKSKDDNSIIAVKEVEAPGSVPDLDLSLRRNLVVHTLPYPGINHSVQMALEKALRSA